jgi:hypothetical protein
MGPSGELSLIGSFIDTLVDLKTGKEFLVGDGEVNLFIIRTDSNGNVIQKFSVGGQSGWCHGQSICIDKSGCSYISGVFYGSIDINPGPEKYIVASNLNSDAFVAKLDTNGSLRWFSNIGGELTERNTKIYLSNKNIYISCSAFGPLSYYIDDKKVNVETNGNDVIMYKMRTNDDRYFVKKESDLITSYPNPTSGINRIDLGKFFEEITINIFDVQGRRVSSQSFYSSREVQLNLRSFSSGIYTAEIVFDGEKEIVRLLKVDK